MDQSTILIVGIFVFLLLAIGAALTIDEFRKMEEHPEDYVRPEDRDDEENKPKT